jgi:nucleotide-binding universal stress UspA family protein
MPGVILAVLDHPAPAGSLLAAARCLADLTGASRITALLVRTPPDTSIASEEILTAQREAELRALEAQRADAVRTEFDAWLPATEQAGFTAEWIDIDGIAEQIIEERGGRTDFLVVGQPARCDYGTSWHAMRAALFTTDRPVLVVPAAATPAMPAILAEHDVNAELHIIPIGAGAFGATLLGKAHELGADMLMMGAYEHNPLREFLLGGVTRYMLDHIDIPVLMRH